MPIRYKKYLLYSFLIFGVSLIHINVLKAQFIPVDSLESLLSKKLPEATRVKVLCDLAREFVYVDGSQALKLAEESRDLAIKIGSRLDEANALRIIAATYEQRNFYSVAIETTLKAYQIFSEGGDSVGMANCNITSGNIYRNQKLYKKSAEYHHLSYIYFKAHGPDHRFAITALNYGEALFYLDSIPKAKRILKQAIEINNKVNNLSAQTFAYKAMGLIYDKQQQYDSAEYYYLLAINASKVLGKYSQKEATVESLIKLSTIYKKLNKNDKLIEILLDAELFNQKYNVSIGLTDIYLSLAEYYSSNGNLKMSNLYIKKYRAVKDSLETIELQSREAALNTVYNTLKLELENNVLEEQRIESQNLIKKQRVRLIGIFLLAVAALSALVYALLQRSSLKKSNKLLNKQAIQIKQKSKELEELNASKDKMFSIVTHDLKSPLHSMLGFSDLVKNYLKDLSEEEIIQMIDSLKDKVSATLTMMENLTEWAKLQMDKASIFPKKFNMTKMVLSINKVYQSSAGLKGIKLLIDMESDLYAYADSDQIELIIRNLMNNAIKFTPKGGTISITGIQESDRLLIKIADTGKGLTDDEKENLFKLSMTSTRGTEGEKGSGLGLILCQEYAHKNNASISVTSQVNNGSVFTLALPIQ